MSSRFLITPISSTSGAGREKARDILKTHPSVSSQITNIPQEKGNDSYSFSYLYKICIDIEKGARTLVLPKDAGVAVFAVTLTDSPAHDVKAVTAMRVIPAQTKTIEYTTRTVPFFNERSQW